MYLIHGTYLFLLGLGCLCFYFKPQLVVAMETVKSHHGQDLMAFTKKQTNKWWGHTVKPIHFNTR